MALLIMVTIAEAIDILRPEYAIRDALIAEFAAVIREPHQYFATIPRDIIDIIASLLPSYRKRASDFPKPFEKSFIIYKKFINNYKSGNTVDGKTVLICHRTLAHQRGTSFIKLSGNCHVFKNDDVNTIPEFLYNPYTNERFANRYKIAVNYISAFHNTRSIFRVHENINSIIEFIDAIYSDVQILPCGLMLAYKFITRGHNDCLRTTISPVLIDPITAHEVPLNISNIPNIISDVDHKCTLVDDFGETTAYDIPENVFLFSPYTSSCSIIVIQ